MENWKSDVPSQLPDVLEKALFQKLKSETNSLQNIVWLEDFRAAIRRGFIPTYKHDWGAFHYLFFAANFLKAYKAFQALIQIPNSNGRTYRILDLGCGAGAASAGILAAILNNAKKTYAQIEFVGVDHDPTQVLLFQEIFGVWAQTETGVSIKTIRSGVLDFLESNLHGWDLIVCSYMLVEGTPKQHDKLEKMFELITRTTNANVLVIDYEPGYSDGAATCLPINTHLYFYEMSISLSLLHSLCPEVCPKYCTHSRTLSPLPLPNPLASYFECWRKQDATGLQKIFSSDATYEINVGRRLCGVEEIMDYWKQNSIEQSQVECVVHNFTGNTKEQIAHWTSRFFRVDRNEIYSVHGIIWLEIDEGRVRRLIEFYNKNVFQMPDERPLGRATPPVYHANNNYLN